MGLFIKKPLDVLLGEASATGDNTLKRSLTSMSLVALGIGAVIGAGLFSITGMAAANYAGPGIMISFIIAAVGCAFAGLCYAEFASMIPVAGSAYTYSYATMGEFIAWVIGWDLVLEYAVGAATVASSWAGYIGELFKSFGVALPPEMMMSPFDSVTTASGEVIHGLINFPAVFIIVVMSLVLIRGTSESAVVNAIIVVLKVSIVLVFIFVGWKYIRPENLKPLIPQNTGSFGSFGWSGVVRAAAVVFFAYIGFDAVSTAAQETKNPKKAMPIGILGSLAICTVLYIFFAYVMTGVANYKLFNAGGSADLAPVAIAIKQMGPVGVDGLVSPAFPWLNTMIIIAILLGYSSVILVMLLGQSRVFYSMSTDRLLPKVFSDVHKKFRTPYKSNLLFMLFVSLFAAFVPGRVVGEMTSIGTLFAFILVCAGVIVMRAKMKDAPRGFRVPLVPYIPILGILVCFGMMATLPFDTWIRLLVWMLIGLDVYIGYGVRRSLLNANEKHMKDKHIISLCGILLAVVLLIISYMHYVSSPEDAQDSALFYFSMGIGIIHLVYFIYRTFADKKKASVGS